MSQSVNAEQALAWVRRGFLSLPDEMQDPELDRRLYWAERVGACFGQYPEVLQLILDLTLNRPPVNFGLTGDAYRDYAVQRHGQNTVAAALLTYLEMAKTKGSHDVPETVPSAGDASGGRGRRRGRAGSGDAAGLDLGGPAVRIG